MTTADRVRQAAAKIRARAQLASPGPWREEPEGGGTYRVRASHTNGGAAWFAATEGCTHMDAAHIALWSPPVALVIADWLDAVAADKTAGLGTIHPRAIDLTNLILGDTP